PSPGSLSLATLSRGAGEGFLVRIQLAVPVEEVAPALVQIVGREQAAILLQLVGRGRLGPALRVHVRLVRQAVALQQVAVLAGGDDVGPGGAAATGARHDMVEGQLRRAIVVAAILAAEAVAQEDVEPSEGRSARQR